MSKIVHHHRVERVHSTEELSLLRATVEQTGGRIMYTYSTPTGLSVQYQIVENVEDDD